MKNKFFKTTIFTLLFALVGCQNVEAKDYSFTICDTYAWLDYPSVKITPVFADGLSIDPITYEYDSTKLKIDENSFITPLEVGEHSVKAKTEHYETSFKVMVDGMENIEQYLVLKDEWRAKAKQNDDLYSSKGRNGKSTLFIGDSFFDTAFWTNFYTHSFDGKDAFCFGIGGTTTFTWEALFDSFLANKEPKNIVMNCGTNNAYDLNAPKEQTLSSLERLFTKMLDTFKNTNIYYYTTSHRTYKGAEEKYDDVNYVNAKIKEWAVNKDRLKVIDIAPQIDWLKLKDGIHPKLEVYDLYVEELYKAGIEIENL